MYTDTKRTPEGLVALRKAYAVACNVETKSYQRMLDDYTYANVDDLHDATLEVRRIANEITSFYKNGQ